MAYAYFTMNDKASNYRHGDSMSQFQQLTHSIVDKYCSMPLPYRPGLYSIQWESSYRINGLLHELNTTAVQILQSLGQSGNTSAIRQELHDVIHRSLLQYIEKIYGVDYPNTEQPEWMVQIARRLQQNASISF